MEDKHWAILCHVMGMVGCMFTSTFGFVACIVIWACASQESRPLLDKHGIAAINFYASIYIYQIVAGIFITIASTLYSYKLQLGIEGFLNADRILSISAWSSFNILIVVCVVMAVAKANQGKDFRYPLSISIIK